MRSMWHENLSIHNEDYDALYRQCTHIIPELADILPKPEASSELVQDAPPQRSPHDCQAPPAPLSPARSPSPPIPEILTSPTDPTASALAAPVDPLPLTLARTLALSTASPSPPQAIGQPKGPRRIATTTSHTPAAPASDHLSLTPPLPLVPPLPPSLTSPSPLPSSSPPSLSPPLQLPPVPTVYDLPLPPPSPPPSLLSPPPVPQHHERTLPPPSSITTALPKPSEATKAQPNNCRMQEQTNISSIRNNDVNPIMKPQVQVPYDNNHNPNNIKGNPTRNNSNSNHSSIRNCNNHPGKPSDFSTSDNCKFMYDLGGSTLHPKDGSTRNVSDSTSSSSSDSAPCTTATDTHHSRNCDHDKTVLMASNINSMAPIDFAQAIPVGDIFSLHLTNNLPTILLCNSTHIDIAQHLPSYQRPAHPLNFDGT